MARAGARFSGDSPDCVDLADWMVEQTGFEPTAPYVANVVLSGSELLPDTRRQEELFHQLMNLSTLVLAPPNGPILPGRSSDSAA